MAGRRQSRKYCPSCDSDKPTDAFPKNRRRYDGLGSVCKECNRAMQNRWYHRQPDAHKKVVAERRRKNRETNRRKLMEYLAGRGCETCHEKDPVVLEFHHPNRDKEYNIGDMIASGYSWIAILKELGKCQVQCANDHRRIEAKKRGSYRLLTA